MRIANRIAGCAACFPKAVLGFLLLLCLTAEGLGATRPAVTNAPPKAATPPPQTFEIAVQKSIFVTPVSAKEGRNPFFPRAQVIAQVPTEKNQSLDASVFILNGLTGPPQRSAMINGRTFFVGEEGEVRLQSGAKVLIRCTEISDGSAVISVGGMSRELRMRRGI